MKHTEGPWFYNRHAITNYNPKDPLGRGRKGARFIAMAPSNADGNEFNEQDARLMAKSPNMLKTLQDAEKTLDGLQSGEFDREEIIEQIAQLLPEIWATIEEATGTDRDACSYCNDTGDMTGQGHLDCTHCSAATIIAKYEKRKKEEANGRQGKG